MEQPRAEQRASRLAEMRRRLGITQGRVSAIEHARPGTTELRTLAAYGEALGGRLESIADRTLRITSARAAPRGRAPGWCAMPWREVLRLRAGDVGAAHGRLIRRGVPA